MKNHASSLPGLSPGLAGGVSWKEGQRLQIQTDSESCSASLQLCDLGRVSHLPEPRVPEMQGKQPAPPPGSRRQALPNISFWEGSPVRWEAEAIQSTPPCEKRGSAGKSPARRHSGPRGWSRMACLQGPSAAPASGVWKAAQPASACAVSLPEAPSHQVTKRLPSL